MSNHFDKHQFIWRIENFSAFEKKLFVAFKKEKNFNFVLSTESEVASDMDGFLEVILIKNAKVYAPTKLYLEFQICLINRYAEKCYKQWRKFVFEAGRRYCFRLMKKSDLYEEKDTLIPNDILTLLVEARKCDSRKLSLARTVISSTINVERTMFVWTIRGLSGKGSTNKNVVHIQNSFTKMKFEYCTDERETLGKEMLRLALKLVDPPGIRIFVSAKVEVMDSGLHPHTKMEADHIFEDGSDGTWILPAIDIRNCMGNRLERDQLELACNFTISDGAHHQLIRGSYIPLADAFLLEEDLHTLRKDISSVHDGSTEIDPDMILKTTDGWAVGVHKLVLGARSLFFREALTNLAEEKKKLSTIPRKFEDGVSFTFGNMTFGVKNCIDYACIPIHSQIFKPILTCMYTDTITFYSVEDTMQLYSAGAMLEFIAMKEKSENYLISEISLKSYFPLLEFAHSTRIVRLKAECINFISNNQNIVIASQEWITIQENHKDLEQEIRSILIS